MLSEPLLSPPRAVLRRGGALPSRQEILLVGLGLGLGLLVTRTPPSVSAGFEARHAIAAAVLLAMCAVTFRLASLRGQVAAPTEAVRYYAAPMQASPLPPPPAAPPTNELMLSVNGQKHVLRDPSPSLLLSDWLRAAGLTGTKVGCGEGGCGACTVIAVGADGVPRAINACLRLLCACDGLAVTTIEGLGSRSKGYSAAMTAIAEGQGSQCGFCTPGWVSAMSALLASHAKAGAAGGPSPKQIEEALDGNLCRCTGYRPILQAFKEAFGHDARDTPHDGPDAIQCCKARGQNVSTLTDGALPVADIESDTACHDVRSGAACARDCDAAPPKRGIRVCCTFGLTRRV